MTEIYFKNALSGSGKTFGAVTYAKFACPLGEKIILAQPTRELNTETVRDTFTNPAVCFTYPYRLINSDTCPNRVHASLIDYFKNEGATGGGKLLTTTHASILALKFIPPSLSEFTLILDEEIEVLKSWTIDVPVHHAIVTDHLHVVKTEADEYWALSIKGTAEAMEAIDAIADNEEGDVVNKLFQEMCQYLRADQTWSVFVNAADYERLLNPKDAPGRLRVHAELSPSFFDRFKRVIVMSACFTELLLHKVWERKVTYTPFVHPAFKLRFDQHTNGPLIDVYYLFGGQSRWSRTAQDKIATDHAGADILDESGLPLTNLDLLIRKAAQLVGSEAVAVHANKERNGRPPAERSFQNAIRLPSRTEGMNQFQHIDNIVLLGAFNPSPEMFHFLDRHAGINSDDVYQALTSKAIYQAINRISIRDPNSTSRKKVVVATERDADYILSLYPGATKHQFTSGLNCNSLTRRSGRKPLNGVAALTPEERKQRFIDQRRYKLEVIKERMTRLAIVNGTVQTRRQSIADKLTGPGGAMALEYAAIQRSNLRNRESFHGTLLKAREQTKCQLAPAATFDELVEWLKGQIDPSATRKEDGLLLSPCHYANHNRHRDSNNHAFARHIMLDFDEGQMTPHLFAETFPEWRMVIWSSWRSQPNAPRFRVLIETDRLIDLEGYKLITRGLIAGRLRDKLGFLSKEQIARGDLIEGEPPVGCHGLDLPKTTAKSFFYVPCIGEYHNFFYDHRVGRGAMNVEEVLRSPEVPVPPMPTRPPKTKSDPTIEPGDEAAQSLAGLVNSSIGVPRYQASSMRQQSKIDAAIERWRAEGDRDGHRNDGLYTLALSLVYAGCGEDEAERIVNEVAVGEHANCGARFVKNARAYADSRHG